MAYTTINKPSEYFNTVTYAGNSSATQSITGVNFQPDLVWIKQRNLAYSHILFDAIRGVGKNLQSSGTAAEETNNSVGYLSAFDSDGFTVSQGSSSGDRVNGAYNYVSWNWLANGSGVSNTDGSTTSTVSANQTSGFSIVKWVGVNTTVGHGLNAVPEMIIVKNTDDATNWFVYHKTLGNNKFINLNLSSAETTSSNQWNSTSPTSSVFTVGSDFNNANYIAYCFAEKKGFSKIGSYTGNGNADGTFVYTGFKPAFVLVKLSSGAQGWGLFDNKRIGYNPRNNLLIPSDTGAEYTSGFDVDILSNGFKVRTTDALYNGSGSTYIYMAFAEQPLVGTNNIPATAR